MAYLNVFYDRKNSTIHIWDDKAGHITVPETEVKYAYRRSQTGLYRNMFGEKLEKITRYNPADPSLFESDVPETTRILVDSYYDSDEISTGHTVLVLDIEVDSEGGFPDMSLADKKITAISLYDKSTQKYIAMILDEDRIISNKTEGDTEILSYDNEESLLSAFLNKWEEIGPTIVTGWNSRGTHSGTAGIEGIGFDIPYLYQRIRNCMGYDAANRLSPIGIVYKSKFRGEIIIAGVCTALDYLPMYKRFSGVREPSYQLGKIGLKEVGIGKLSYEGSLHNLYKTDINKYIEYNLNDVRIVVELDKKYNYIDQAREICHFCHVPYEYFEVSSRFLEGAVLTQLKKDGLIACNKPIGGREEYAEQIREGEEGFIGAYVKEPIPGRYEWIYDLDMQSLYPSVIQSLNISSETLIGTVYILNDDGNVENWDSNKFASNDIKRVKIGTVDYSINEFNEMLVNKNVGVASNGAMYLLSEIGIIPKVIEKWLVERKNVRKQANDAHEKGDKNTFERLNRKQYALKILSNSIYGCCGLVSWRWYNKSNAEAVTLTGQTLIRTVDKIINNYYTMKCEANKDYVIYCDTDSGFCSSLPLIDKLYPDIDKSDEKQMTDATLKITTDVQNHINGIFNVLSKRMFNVTNHKFFIKQELIAKSAIWLAKKRYMMWVVNEGGRTCSKMDVKGIDVVRSSFPPKFSRFMGEMMKLILNGISENEIQEKILDFENQLLTFDLEDCAKSTSVRFISAKGDKNYNPFDRSMFSFVLGSPAQVRAALGFNDLLKKWNLTKKVEPIFDGQKIRYVYLKDNQFGLECMALKADGTDPIQIIDFIKQHLDVQKMYEHELRSKFTTPDRDGLFDVLKWSYPSIEAKTAKQFFDF